MQFSFVLALIVSIVVSIFAIQNSNHVTIDLFFTSFNISQAIIILISTAIGAIIAVILGSIRQIKNITKIKELKNNISSIESDNLRLNNNIKNKDSEIGKLKQDKDELQIKINELNQLLISKNNENIIIETDNNDKVEEVKCDLVKLSCPNDAYLEKDDEKDQIKC